MVHYKETQFGFEYGAATVQRAFSDDKKGWVTMTVSTKKHQKNGGIQIYVTKTGKVRIFSPEGEWKVDPDEKSE